MAHIARFTHIVDVLVVGTQQQPVVGIPGLEPALQKGGGVLGRAALPDQHRQPRPQLFHRLGKGGALVLRGNAQGGVGL